MHVSHTRMVTMVAPRPAGARAIHYPDARLLLGRPIMRSLKWNAIHHVCVCVCVYINVCVYMFEYSVRHTTSNNISENPVTRNRKLFGIVSISGIYTRHTNTHTRNAPFVIVNALFNAALRATTIPE